MSETRLSAVPSMDGYYMPAEFAPHQGCILIWPERPGSWTYGAKGAREAFTNVISAIAESEMVYLAAGEAGISSAISNLFGADSVWDEEKGVYRLAEGAKTDGWRHHVQIFPAQTDDAWARDVAPTFVIRKDGEEGLRAINWEFNAWGGEVDGLYASWELDNAFARKAAKQLGVSCYDASPFVLEGGSIHSDGEGTILVTESCLLSAGRNPHMSKDEIAEKLCAWLGAEKVLWLPYGIYQDETNEHVDNVCAFIKPGEVVLAWTDDENDPQYAMSMADLSYLEQETDAKGRKIRVHKLPIPSTPVCVSEYDLAGYVFEEGEDMREAGERLAASYVNFYFSNEAVVMPVFGGENEESDQLAVSIMKELNPDRQVIPVYAREILVGGGNIHCITQQVPLGKKGNW